MGTSWNMCQANKKVAAPIYVNFNLLNSYLNNEANISPVTDV